MAYTVLARRYRSSTFDDLVGQGHVAQTLKRAITSGRIAHAYLFTGTRGTGKTSTARILAKALNCMAGDAPTPTPCCQCTSCLGIARGDDMDYLEIDAASHTGVDKARETIIDNVAYRPARCRFKIFLIDEVHMLSKSAFNALLKTFEEPPEHVKFILATTEAEKIPTTILSRCQRYDFRNIPTREVAAHLRHVCESEKIEAEESALAMVARAGAGSMRDSLSLLDRLLSVGERKLTAAAIEQLLGVPKAQEVADLVTALGSADPGQALRKTDAILSSGMSADVLLGSLVDHLHQLLLLRVCGKDTDLVEPAGISRETLLAQANVIDPVTLTQDIAVLEELRRQMRLGGSRALLDAVVVRLALAEQFTSISRMIAGVGAPETTTTAAPTAHDSRPTAHDSRPAAHEPVPEQKKKSDPPPPTPTHPTPVTPVTPVTPALVATPTNSAPAVDESSDDLPAVGKVWEPDKGPSLVELLNLRPKSPAKLESANTEPEAANTKPESANIEPVDEGRLPEVWRKVIDGFRDQRKLHLLLQNGRLSEVTDEQAVVTFGSEQRFMIKQLETDGQRRQVSEALAGVLGRQVGLKIEVEKDAAPTTRQTATPSTPRSPSSRPTLSEIEAMAADADPRALAQRQPTAATVAVSPELIEELRKHEVVRSVLDTLGAEVVRVTDE
jgi:DNA polymerase III subunit gamma/tau